mmetsp:Transcript_21928/g.32800  ORF Transcript_21928/g.32800 Transcript_21928/m.32800 type:complete len:258 (-) Transcript_21928:302-1075(-)
MPASQRWCHHTLHAEKNENNCEHPPGVDRWVRLEIALSAGAVDGTTQPNIASAEPVALRSLVNAEPVRQRPQVRPRTRSHDNAADPDSGDAERPLTTTTLADCWNRMRDKDLVESELGLAENGDPEVSFFDASAPAHKIAQGYERIVYGDHGPYVEFRIEQIEWQSLPVVILKPNHAYYDEYYTEGGFVKLYKQKRTVEGKANPPPGGVRHNRTGGYADYKVDMCYISPSNLTTSKPHPTAVHGHASRRWKRSTSRE